MTRRVDVTAARRRKLVAQYDKGASIRGLAAEVGLSYGAVRNILVRAGVTMRPPGGPRRKATP